MDNKDNTVPNRPYESKFIMRYPCGYKPVDRSIPRHDNETNRGAWPAATRDFHERRHGQ